MAWWDSEELKSLEDRSVRYKLSFYYQYRKTKKEMIHNLITSHEATTEEIVKHLDPYSESSLVDYAWSLDSRFRVKDEDCEPQQCSDAVNDRRQEYDPFKYAKEKAEKDVEPLKNALERKNGLRQDGLQVQKNSNSLKFNEDIYLKELSSYIYSTYGQHYAEDQDVQSIEMIISSGHGEGFVMGNIQKLSARYGKKDGYNRADLLKILHYGVLALHIHDKFEKGKK